MRRSNLQHPDLRRLPLPRMPMGPSSSSSRIRILCACDVDLPSAARLAEFALHDRGVDGSTTKEGREKEKDRDWSIGGGNVDLCLVVGPFSHPDPDSDEDDEYDDGAWWRQDDGGDLLGGGCYIGPHYGGYRHARTGGARSRCNSGRVTRVLHDRSYLSAVGADNLPSGGTSRRCRTGGSGATLGMMKPGSPEARAAMLGAMTAALSQLETVVCRVAYVPGSTDPVEVSSPVMPEGLPECLRVGEGADNSNGSGDGNGVQFVGGDDTFGNERNFFGYGPAGLGSAGSGNGSGIGGYERVLTGDEGEHRRLTPNSRNVQRRWLHLAPGLGCAGLCHCQGDDSSDSPQERSTIPARPKDEEDGNVNDERRDLVHTREALLRLAPPSFGGAQSCVPMALSSSQCIFISNVGTLGGRCKGSCLLNTDDEALEAPFSSKDSGVDDESSVMAHMQWPGSWPSAYRDSLDRPLAQQQILFEVTGPPPPVPRCDDDSPDSEEEGKGVKSAKHDVFGDRRPPHQFELRRGNLTLIHPGSLRQRGEFAVVDVALCPIDDANDEDMVQVGEDARGDSRTGGWTSITYQWKVQGVSFRKVRQKEYPHLY